MKTNIEPICWWTDKEREICENNLVISEVKTNWRGKKYRVYTSKALHNIYREDFTWREYE